MMYLTEECGRAVGALISSTGMNAEVEITMDSIVIRLQKEDKTQTVEQTKKAMMASLYKTNKKKRKLTGDDKKKRKWHEGEKVTFNGESLTRREWAEKLGITESGVSYRIQQHGNPFGSKSPKPSDSDKVVAGSK